MALTREQAMGMLFAPPWAPGTYDDATLWNDVHRQYPPANVPVGAPVGSRDAIAQQLMQQPQSSPFGTGDTIRYPGGVAGGLGGAAPNDINAVNNSLDLSGALEAPGGGTKGGLGAVFGNQPPAPDVPQAPPVGHPVGPPPGVNNPAVALDPPVSTTPVVGKGFNDIDQSMPAYGAVTSYGKGNAAQQAQDELAAQQANTPGVSIGAPQLGSRGFSGPPALDPIDTVAAPAPTATRGGIATALADQQSNTAAKGALGGPMSTAPNTSSAPTAPSVNAPMSAPEQDVPEVVTDISQIGLSPAQQSVLDNNFGLSALGKGTETNNPGISSNPTIGPVSSTVANPGTSLAQELAAMTGISTPASNNFGLSALGTPALGPATSTNAPSVVTPVGNPLDIAPTAAPTAIAPVGQMSIANLDDVVANALSNEVSTTPANATSTMGQVDPGQFGFGTAAPAADPNAPDAQSQAATNATVAEALDAMSAEMGEAPGAPAGPADVGAPGDLGGGGDAPGAPGGTPGGPSGEDPGAPSAPGTGENDGTED